MIIKEPLDWISMTVDSGLCFPGLSVNMHVSGCVSYIKVQYVTVRFILQTNRGLRIT